MVYIYFSTLSVVPRIIHFETRGSEFIYRLHFQILRVFHMYSGKPQYDSWTMSSSTIRQANLASPKYIVVPRTHVLPTWRARRLEYYFCELNSALTHYQKQGNSCRPKTVRNNKKAVRNGFPDGQPSGTIRQEPLARKEYYSLSDGRQETIPVGNSCRGEVWPVNSWFCHYRRQGLPTGKINRQEFLVLLCQLNRQVKCTHRQEKQYNICL